MPLLTSLSEAVALLRALPVFGGLPQEEFAALATQCRSDVFKAGENIFYQDDPCERLWLIYKGQIKIIRHDENGREVVPEILSNGEAFGGATIFFTHQPATAQALTDVETISFPSSLYADFLLEHPEIALNFIRMLGARLQTLMVVSMLTGERVERRLAHILIKLAERTGRPDREGTLITIPLSRQDLADMSGTTIETAIRIMSRFRSEGLVKTRRGGYVVLLDCERLRQIARTG
jgi:CRP-like cAMP-binding protein